MRETTLFITHYLVRGFTTNNILSDFKSDYFGEISNASEEDFTSAMAFYDDIQDEIFEKRRAFMVSCDYDPSEELDELWCEETAEFYTDLFFN
jgi:hypothetical protein